MLRGLDGKPLSTGNVEKAESKKLRGKTLEEIEIFSKSDKRKDKGFTWKGQAIEAGKHINWFLDRARELVQAAEAMNQEGVWNQNPVSFGFNNGLIMALAILIEETGNPPYRKLPESFLNTQEDAQMGIVLSYVLNLLVVLEGCLCVGEDGKPKGYEEYPEDEAWGQWRGDALQRIFSVNFDTVEIKATIERIRKYEQSLMKQMED